MSKKLPLLLRKEGDPLDELRETADQYERLAGRTVGDYQGRAGGRAVPPLLYVASGIDAYFDAGHPPDLISDTELATAAQRTGLSNFDFDGAEKERLRGALTALRGAIGEEWTLEQIKNGNLPTPSGTAAVELMSFRNPASDLVFTDRAGHVIGEANVKVAGSADVIARHFAENNGVTMVFASSDAASDAAHRGFEVWHGGSLIGDHGQIVVDIGRSSADFDASIGHQLSDAHSAGVHGIEFLHWFPWLSMGVITARAIQRIRAGESRAEVMRGVAHGSVASISGTAAGHAVSTITSSEPAVALAAFLVSGLSGAAMEVRGSWKDVGKSHDNVAQMAEEIVAKYDLAPEPRSWWGRLAGRL